MRALDFLFGDLGWDSLEDASADRRQERVLLAKRSVEVDSQYDDDIQA